MMLQSLVVVISNLWF